MDGPGRAQRLARRLADQISPGRRRGPCAFEDRDGQLASSPTTSSKRAFVAREVPDEWVVLGNHHDAWVFGGVDPSSGTASMMEMTRAFGQLLKKACVRNERWSSAVGTARKSDLPDPPNGASSSPTSCGRKPSPTSTSTLRPRVQTWMAARSASLAPMLVRDHSDLAGSRPANLFMRHGRNPARKQETKA